MINYKYNTKLVALRILQALHNLAEIVIEKPHSLKSGKLWHETWRRMKKI